MRIFLSTLEPSGDVLCADLARELALQNPMAQFYGIGGPRMVDAGVKLIDQSLIHLSSLGILNNLVTGPRFLLSLKIATKWILKNKPDRVVLCDSRFFNLNLAKEIRNAGYTGTIAYYIAPVTWQSLYNNKYLSDEKHLRRFRDIKEYCNFAILAYPVSLEIYQKLKIEHYFFGHPLTGKCKAKLSRADFCSAIGIAESARIIGVFPGIRPSEYKYIAPVLAKVSEQLVADGYYIACDVPLPIKDSKIISISNNMHFDLIAHSDVVISKSGTVVQECTLLTKPVICVYKVPDWQAWFARKVLKFSMPFYSLPNLLSGMAIIPELIQEDFTESNVLQKTRELLNISELHTKTVERLAKVRHMIAGEAAVVQAANRILQD